MQFGIHLPHAGEQARPALIRRFAMHAEALGLDDVWVSEHIIVPRDQFPRSPLFYDPVLTLTWVAAVTQRVRLGTSVLVLPMRHPLPLAKELATLHNLSERRLILGAGVGWLEPEFRRARRAVPERGRRIDEGIAMMRAVWTQDPVTFASRYIPAEITDMTMSPLPDQPDPDLAGRQFRCGAEAHDPHRGWLAWQSPHAPNEAAPIVRRLRAERPDPDFTISMRTHWNGRDVGELRARIEAYAAIGVGHVMVAPENRETDDWDSVIAGVERIVQSESVARISDTPRRKWGERAG